MLTDKWAKGVFEKGKYTFSFKRAKNIPIKGVDNKRQITATFAVSCTGKFLPVQLIYAGKTEWSLPKFSFLPSFSEKTLYAENNCDVVIVPH